MKPSQLLSGVTAYYRQLPLLLPNFLGKLYALLNENPMLQAGHLATDLF